MNRTLLQIQARLRLRRRITLTAPSPVALVRERLAAALSEKIVLKGQFQLTRYYWGQLNHNHLTLYGPRANRQFCFLTQGELSYGGIQTQFDGHMYLRALDFYQLMLAIAVLIVALSVVLRWFGLTLMPLFLGFFYGMVQWHFQCYQGEITRLLTRLMADPEAKSSV